MPVTVHDKQCKFSFTVNQHLLARSSFRDLSVMKCFTTANFYDGDNFKQIRETVKDWFVARNFGDDEVIANLAKISGTRIKFNLQ